MALSTSFARRIAMQMRKGCQFFSVSANGKPQIVHETDALLLKSLPVTPFAMNQYLLGCKETKEAVLIDCGDDQPQRWVDAAEEENMKITQILQTHGHVDHVSGLKQTRELLGEDVPIVACPEDWSIFKSAPAQGLMFGMSCPMPPAIDVDVNEGDTVNIGNLEVAVLHTPGHSPGHIAFHITSEKVLVSGDLVFQGSIGRTDFPGCNQEDMNKSLARLKTMDRDTLIFPGHMGITSIGIECDSNPFLLQL